MRLGDGDVVVHCSEVRGDGKPVGELEVAVFQAALVIDRDGILAEKACTAAETETGRSAAAKPIMLPGASGYRADAERRAPLPYVNIFAIAPHDLGVQSGVLVTVRSATPDWPAADAILASLRILTRGGRTANDEDEAPSILPLIGRKPSGGRSDS